MVESLPERWALYVTIAASLTNSVLEANVSEIADNIKMIRAGSITGIDWRLSSNVATGTLTVTVTKNGVPVTLAGASTNALNSGGGQNTQAPGIDTYVAGDLIGVVITTTGDFTPTANDIEVWLEVTPT